MPDAGRDAGALTPLGERWLIWEARLVGPWALGQIRRSFPPAAGLRDQVEQGGAPNPAPRAGPGCAVALPFLVALVIAVPYLVATGGAPPSRAWGLLAFALVVAWIGASSAVPWRVRTLFLGQIVILDRFYHLLVERSVASGALWDSTFLAADRALLGPWPIALGQHPPSWIVEVLGLAYGLFIPYLFSSLFLAALARPIAPGKGFFTGLTSVYAFSYLGYLAFPTLGPKAFPLYDAPLAGVAIWPLVHRLSIALGSHADAFPSLHTAAVVYMLDFDRRHLPARFALYLPWGLLIVLSTVILREHYVVDLLAGGLIGVVGGGLARCVRNGQSS